ncbi:ATPase, V1/A1 complex, subunit E [Wallemia mellicola CBS 633.66]|uniref:ATPase, V1/A1 complex, subunit E n=1 Tax=Wallemia mellicola (strain ATCC MYA-4683 / CBS 633.66) TaxID=671144 RepID=I4Y910_WALMC|nr:ATPase, V1/A1 complex, subunit E [Wallemia mellicola CBS 633.66]EIM20452.1 ATPase, V1/A1 complex, subunit E [Wallemia mellicola CBS 633.66]TIB75963.1 hypothetical protein E3Q23_02081 [Wallemia mellicola]|eukprot:XP_006959478.1 ATPase, V1/A1 complex, subunit E [Wallemia mellicola CBS 633.66]
MSKPLDDEEVKQELNKMVSFIKQEAEEKARELRVKADEEYENEKAKIVAQEQHHLNAVYDKKFKQALVARKIAQSTQTNKARLRVLSSREEHLNSLFEEVKNKVDKLSESDDYADILRRLIVQSMLKLMEGQVIIQARPKDEKVIESILDDAKNEFKEATGKDVDAQIQTSLEDASAGGVKLNGFGGRISIDNTIEARLSLLEDRMLPEIRMDLFGQNPNRKFDN